MLDASFALLRCSLAAYQRTRVFVQGTVLGYQSDWTVSLEFFTSYAFGAGPITILALAAFGASVRIVSPVCRWVAGCVCTESGCLVLVS